MLTKFPVCCCSIPFEIPLTGNGNGSTDEAVVDTIFCEFNTGGLNWPPVCCNKIKYNQNKMNWIINSMSLVYNLITIFTCANDETVCCAAACPAATAAAAAAAALLAASCLRAATASAVFLTAATDTDKLSGTTVWADG